MKKVYFLGLLAVLILVLVPAMASAHTATVQCDDQGGYLVTPDYLQYNPTWEVQGDVMVVTWTDGFVARYPLPGPCLVPEQPPVPPVPEEVPVPPVVVIPPPIPVAPTCAELLARYPKAGPVRRAAWGCPAPVIKLPPKPDKPKRKITTRYFGCPYVGARARKVIIVTLPSGKVGRVTIWGKRCKLPAVAG